ncbi:phage portal protein, partial [Haematospirillum jordaniae]
MNILDRLFRRTASAVRRRPGARFSRNFFDSASTDRLTQSWSTTPVSADEVVRRNYTSLVARSRHEADNNDYAKKFVRLCVQNIVGPKG